MDEFKALLASIALMVILILILGVAPVYLFSKANCSAKAEAQGYDYEYGFFKGCMVKTEKGWMDYDRLIYKRDAE